LVTGSVGYAAAHLAVTPIATHAFSFYLLRTKVLPFGRLHTTRTTVTTFYVACWVIPAFALLSGSVATQHHGYVQFYVRRIYGRRLAVVLVCLPVRHRAVHRFYLCTFWLPLRHTCHLYHSTLPTFADHWFPIGYGGQFYPHATRPCHTVHLRLYTHGSPTWNLDSGYHLDRITTAGRFTTRLLHTCRAPLPTYLPYYAIPLLVYHLYRYHCRWFFTAHCTRYTYWFLHRLDTSFTGRFLCTRTTRDLPPPTYTVRIRLPLTFTVAGCLPVCVPAHPHYAARTLRGCCRLQFAVT